MAVVVVVVVVPVVCGDGVPVALWVCTAGGPAVVRVEGMLVVPVIPGGTVALDVVCWRLGAVSVVCSVNGSTAG